MTQNNINLTEMCCEFIFTTRVSRNTTNMQWPSLPSHTQTLMCLLFNSGSFTVKIDGSYSSIMSLEVHFWAPPHQSSEVDRSEDDIRSTSDFF